GFERLRTAKGSAAQTELSGLHRGCILPALRLHDLRTNCTEDAVALHYLCMANRPDPGWNCVHGNHKRPRGKCRMTYATPTQRQELIAGLRVLAEFLASNPEVPVPPSVDMLVFPPYASD